MTLDYVAYGLRIRSALPLPLPGWSGLRRGEADAEVVLGATPMRLPAPSARRPRWEAAPGRCLVRLPGQARCLVSGGRRIVLERWGCAGDDVAHWLATSVLAALLLQRGIMPLHSSAVATSAGAALFLGESGAGKSSLLGAMVGIGHTMMADDVTGVVLEDEAPIALPGFPRVRLPQDSLDSLGWGADKLALDAKATVPVERFRTAPLRMAACYVLASEAPASAGQAGGVDGCAIMPISAPEARGWLWRHTYRRRRIGPFGQGTAHLHMVSRIAAHVPVFRVHRLGRRPDLPAAARRVAAHLASRSGTLGN